MVEQSEKKITEKVTDKVTKIIDKRVNTETARLSKEIDNKIQNLREDFNSELNEINTRLDNERRGNANVNANVNDDERHLRVVVRNLPEAVNENIKQKVDSVIKDGLKIADINVVSAERKESWNDSRPGVVIAKFRNSEEKKRVMTAKTVLRNNRQYSQVYINHDLSKEERNMASNMRTLLNGVRRGHNLQIRGTRVVAAEETTHRDGRWNIPHEGRTDGDAATEGYRSRNTDRGNRRQTEDISRSDTRREDNVRSDRQWETTRNGMRGNTGRGRNGDRQGHNQWDNRRH